MPLTSDSLNDEAQPWQGKKKDANTGFKKARAEHSGEQMTLL